MHTHFDDNDWQAAAARYRASVALPDALLVAGLDDVRTCLSKEDESSEPVQAGLSFQQIIQQNKDAKRLYDEHCASITDHPTSKEATTLSQAILQGKWTVRQVIDAFLVKAALAQQVLGCFTEIYFDAARERADELDATYAKATTKDAAHLGSLFGVPVSIKAHLGLQGFGSDRGFVFDVLDSATTDRLISQEERSGKTPASTIALLRKQGQHTLTATGHMVSTLLSEGAVVLGKTTMPQGIMHLDTRSNLHGQTLNPINIHLSPGGSSGGEAASVASGATLAGLGTDIGGSVRQPAACVGLFGIRPTCGRVTTSGARATMLGNEGVMGTAGPFARSMRDLEVLTQVTIKQSYQVDPYMCPPLPWRGVQMPKNRIRIGVMLDDGYVQPITPIRRAMHHVAEKLKNTSQAAHGVEVVFVDPKDFGERAWNLVRQLYFMDNGHLLGALARMTGEPLTKLSKYILDPPHVQERSGADTWLLNYTREAFKREFWQTMFVQNKLDALICPASALCAPRPQQIHYWGYTSLFNLTDLPGITFPIEGFEANASVDEKYEQSQQGKCKSSYGEMDQSVKQEYEQNRNVFERAPVGLQIIGHRFCEEELFGILRVVLGSLV